MKRILGAITLFVVLFGTFSFVYYTSGGLAPDYSFSENRYFDLSRLYALVPAYWLIVSYFQLQRSKIARELLEELSGKTFRVEADWIRYSILVLGSVMGLVYGLWDFRMARDVPVDYQIMENTLKFGNGLVWASNGLLLSWRLYFATHCVRIGRHINIDLHRADQLRPLGRVGSLDVFGVMGILALSPLQSLSSDFRWEYYEAAFAIGIPGAIALFFLPMLGVRQAVRRAKQERLAEVDSQLKALSTGDLSEVNTLLDYRSHLKEVPEWPVDTRLISRVLLYLIVPPLAWVGAAIVERGVDQFF